MDIDESYESYYTDNTSHIRKTLIVNLKFSNLLFSATNNKAIKKLTNTLKTLSKHSQNTLKTLSNTLKHESHVCHPAVPQGGPHGIPAVL